MTLLTPQKLARAYLIVALVLSAVVSSPLQLAVALALLTIQLYTLYKQPNEEQNLILVLATLILAPIAFEAIAGQTLAFIVMLPGLLLLDTTLKNHTKTQHYAYKNTNKNPTNTLKGLAIALLLTFIISLSTQTLTLILSSTALIIYLTATTINTYLKIPKTPLKENKTWSRTIVGNPETQEFNIENKTTQQTIITLTPIDPWVKIQPTHSIQSPKTQTKATINFTPPLAGPQKIQIQATIVDKRGLIQTNQILEPIDLHIIPKAKYAAWLANKYLEQTSSGGGMGEAIARPTSSAAKRGVEYYGSRQYQVGDLIKDIDWKHSYMLGELIVKQFTGATGQVGILVADLTTPDAEATDKLSYNLIMSALTLATEGLPSALAAFNEKEVLAATPVMNPRETLKQALQITEKITIAQPKQKVLQSIETRRLKRSIEQLGKVGSKSAEKLEKILEFELEAKVLSAKNQPATEALTRVTNNAKGPTVITVTSGMNTNSEALTLTLEKLKEQGHSIVWLK